MVVCWPLPLIKNYPQGVRFNNYYGRNQKNLYFRDATLNNDNLIYVEQKFGGHLGFYEGGFMYSNPLTWQDRMIVKIGHALVAGHASKTTKVNQIFKLYSSVHIFIYFLYIFIFLSLNHIRSYLCSLCKSVNL